MAVSPLVVVKTLTVRVPSGRSVNFYGCAEKHQNHEKKSYNSFRDFASHHTTPFAGEVANRLLCNKRPFATVEPL